MLRSVGYCVEQAYSHLIWDASGGSSIGRHTPGRSALHPLSMRKRVSCGGFDDKVSVTSKKTSSRVPEYLKQPFSKFQPHCYHPGLRSAHGTWTNQAEKLHRHNIYISYRKQFLAFLITKKRCCALISNSKPR